MVLHAAEGFKERRKRKEDVTDEIEERVVGRLGGGRMEAMMV